MTLMRGLAAGVFAIALGACNPFGNSDKGAEAPGLVSWSEIPADSINVPRGVTYRTVKISGETAGEVSHVPDEAGARARTGGVSVRLPDEFEQQAGGALIRITVRALAPRAGATIGVAYSTAESGNSGWRDFALMQTPTEFAFDYQVPRVREGGGDYLGFRSYGDSAVQVLAYRVEVVTPAGPEAATAPAPEPEGGLRE